MSLRRGIVRTMAVLAVFVYRSAGEDRAAAALHDQRGVSLAQAGDLAGAVGEFQAALRLDPESGEARYHLGLALDRDGKTDDAMAAYEETLRRHPKLVEARHMLAGCCAKRGDFEGELRLLAQVVAERPEFAEAHYNYGLALKNHERPREAVEQLNAAVRLEPTNPRFATALGVALAGQGEARAAEVLRRAIRMDPGNVEAHYDLGLALAEQGHDEEAVEEFRKTLALAPGYGSARRALGVTLMHQGKLDEAARELRSTLESSPKDAEAANNLGMVELRRKNVTAAVQSLENAVQLNPNLIKAYFNLAQAYQRAGRAEEARRASQRAAELTAQQRERGRAMVLLESAEQALKEGRGADGLSRLREAVAADPTFPQAQLRLAVVLRDSGGDLEEVTGLLRRVLRLDPEIAEAHYELGRTFQVAGRASAALDEFRTAAEMAPCREEFKRAYGMAALQAGDWAAAAAQMRGVLAWRPGDKEARDAFERALGRLGRAP